MLGDKKDTEDSLEKSSSSTWGFMIADHTLLLVIKTLNYGFMLVAMTFNLWIILTIAIASAVARFVIELHQDRETIK